jgi:hypothetical protein
LVRFTRLKPRTFWKRKLYETQLSTIPSDLSTTDLAEFNVLLRKQRKAKTKRLYEPC